MPGNQFERVAILLFLGLLVFLSACSPAAPQPGDSQVATSPPATQPADTPIPTPMIPTSGGTPAVIWQRSGGIAGICQTLTINQDGSYVLQSCPEGATPVAGRLTAEQKSQLDDLLDRYSAFQWEFAPPQGSADMFEASLAFYGRGSQAPSDEEQQAVNEFISALAGDLLRLTMPSSTTESQGSGIEGQVFLGPACPGPVRAESPCPDRPYQATITVLTQDNQQVTQVQTDAEGRFQVSLPPGTYVLHPESPNAYPRAEDQTVTISAGQYTQVKITYESGMR